MEPAQMWLVIFSLFGAVTFAHFAPFPFVLDWANRDVSIWKVRGTFKTPGTSGTPGPSGSSSTPGTSVYLTFDDGPNPEATPALLDVLRRARARATFFIIDRHLTPETAPIVTRMFEEGHGVALHSHTRELMLLDADALVRTLDAAADRMEALTGHRPCAAFRPHGGGRGRSMMRALRQSGRTLVGWGFMLWDWDWFRKPSAKRLVPRIAQRVKAGSIVVLHDGHHENPRADRRYTVETVEQLIPRLRAKGLAFGSVCDAVERGQTGVRPGSDPGQTR